MAKFLELNDAAQMLGVPPDKLVEMRSNGEIRGFRDGASWKFKEDEIERMKEEMSAAGGSIEDELGSADEGSVLDFDDLTPADDDESVLVSEEELGHSSEKTSSTIIGKKGSAEEADSDLKLAKDAPGSDLELADGSELSLASDSGGSDVAFLPESEGTDLNLSSAADLDSELSLEEPDGGSGVGSDVTLVPGVGESDVALVPDPGSDKGAPTEAGRPDSDILADDSELTLDGPGSGGAGNLELGADTGLGSAISDLDMALDSELALSDDDDIVLSGSGTGSDLSLSAADSGINLSSPTDSGLSLEADSGINLQSPTDSGLSLDEEPLDLGGSSISSLELPEDDEIVGLDDALDGLDAGDNSSAPVKKDEEFLLSPSDEMFMDESDSGSQVIALEDSEAFDQDGATLGQPDAGQALLAETAGLEQQLDSLDSGGTPATPVSASMPTPASVTPDAPETPYTIWNVLGLLLIIMFLSLSGVLMTDMMKNMWAWEEEGHEVATGISKALTEAIGLRDE
jgi:excisionase family DNA binding protein